MRKYIFLLVILLLIGGAFLHWKTKNSEAVVILSDKGFKPATIKIKVGESVIFKTNIGQEFWPASDLHPTHGVYSEFDPKEPIASDQSWSFQFTKQGKWEFHDHIRPIHHGTIIVEE